jgi:hypothetical protein
MGTREWTNAAVSSGWRRRSIRPVTRMAPTKARVTTDTAHTSPSVPSSASGNVSMLRVRSIQNRVRLSPS